MAAQQCEDKTERGFFLTKISQSVWCDLCCSFLQNMDQTTRWRSVRVVGLTETTANTWSRSSAPSKVCVMFLFASMHRCVGVGGCGVQTGVCLFVSDWTLAHPYSFCLWLINCLISCVCPCFFTSLSDKSKASLFFSYPFVCWCYKQCVWLLLFAYNVSFMVLIRGFFYLHLCIPLHV